MSSPASRANPVPRALALILVLSLGCGESPSLQDGRASTAAPAPIESTTSQGETTASAASTGLVAADQGSAPPAPSAAAATPSTEPAEPASVLEAVRLFDLRDLSSPDASNVLQFGPFQSMLEVPLGVAEAFEYYEKQLHQRGWKLNDEAGPRQVTDQYAQATYGREGYSLSLSASPSKPGESMVMLNNLGNVDARRLPVFAGAEVLYGGPVTTILISSATVPESGEQCRAALMADGWQPFRLPHTEQAANDDLVQMTFRNRGIELSVMVSKAPAQGNKTAVQYSTSLMTAELPWPNEAGDVEFDHRSLFLQFETALSVERLIEFYRRHLPPLGWDNRDDLDQVREAKATLYFDDAQKNRLLVTATGTDGGAHLKVEHVSAAVLAGLDQQDEPESEPAMPADEPAEPMDDAGTVVAADLPLPENAREVEFDAEAREIRFVSAQSIQNLLKFYRERLVGETWQETLAFRSDEAAMLELSSGALSLSFTMHPAVLSEGVQVTVSGSGLRWAEAATAPLAAMPKDDPAAPEEPQELVAIDQGGFPLPETHTGYASERTPFRESLSATIPAKVDAVLNFYRKELPAAGWNEVVDRAVVENERAELIFSGKEDPLVVKLSTSGDETKVELLLKRESAAKEAGLLPPAGQSVLIFGNSTELPAALSIDGKQIALKPGEGEKKPDGPKLVLAPSRYTLTCELGGEPLEPETFEIGADQIWGAIVLDIGVLPLQMY